MGRSAAILTQEFSQHPPRGNTWPELLRHLAHTNRRALMRYRDGAQVLAHANMPQDVMFRGMERLLHSLTAQGFSVELAMDSFFVVVRFTIGCVFEEQADPRTRSGDKTARRAHLQQNVQRYPVVAKAMMQRADHDEDWQFQRGLDIILAGIATQLDEASKVA